MSPFPSCKSKGWLYARQSHGDLKSTLELQHSQRRCPPPSSPLGKLGSSLCFYIFIVGIFWGIFFLCVLHCVKSLKESFANVK